MTNFLKYLWPILLAVYIISPFDAHPLFLDDLIASGVLFYILYKNAKQRKQQQQYYNYYRQSQSSSQSQQEAGTGPRGPLTLDEAYRLLGVSPDASLDKINKVYREKMSKSHPDKVSHLSEELQEKAKELTLKLNEALDLIKKQK
jgi:hypothetical protein